METKKLRTGMLVLTLLWFGTMASVEAVEPGFYFGAGAGQTTFDAAQREIDTAVSDAFFSELGLLFIPEPEASLDDHDTGFTGLVGYRFNRALAAEAAYVDLGELTYTATGRAGVLGGMTTVPARADLNVETTGVAVSLLGILPSSERWELFLRGGVFLADTETVFTGSAGTFSADFGSASESSTDYLAGIGATVHFGKRWSARAEYRRFLDVGDEDVSERDIELLGLSLLLRL